MNRASGRALGWLWLGQLISTFGDGMFTVALPFLVLHLTGSAAATGLVQMSTYLPVILFGLVAGVVVDRTARRRVMLLSDALRGAVLLLIPLLAASGHLTAVTVGLVAFGVTTFGAFFNPARDALIPQLVGSDPAALARANALMQTSQHLGFFAGPLLAGLAATVLPIEHLFTLDALTFFASFACLLAVPTLAPTAVGRANPWAEVRAGLRELTRDRRLGAIVGLTTLNNLFIMGFAVVVVPLYVKWTLGADVAAYGWIEAAMALGMLAAGAALATGRVKIPSGRLWAVGLILDGLTFLPFYWIRSVPLAVAAMAIHGLFIPLVVVPRTAMLQRWTAPDKLGRVFAVQDMTVRGVTALSAGLAGLLATQLSIPTLILLAASGGAACGVLALLIPQIGHE